MKLPIASLALWLSLASPLQAGLEWETTSPPDPHNFESVPDITHATYDYDKVMVESTLK